MVFTAARKLQRWKVARRFSPDRRAALASDRYHHRMAIPARTTSQNKVQQMKSHLSDLRSSDKPCCNPTGPSFSSSGITILHGSTKSQLLGTQRN